LCDRWLPAWTGGRAAVERLLSHYAEDCLYLDPARPEGITSRDELRAYFTTLLRKNPHWSWEAAEIIPTACGFVLKWQAQIPVGTRVITLKGLDIVEVEAGLISRNEVYFDRTLLLPHE
jgi:hypothetical protein